MLELKHFPSGKVPPQSQKHSINGYTVECKKKFADSHPVQKRIKRIQQQKRERAMAYENAMGIFIAVTSVICPL